MKWSVNVDKGPRVGDIPDTGGTLTFDKILKSLVHLYLFIRAVFFKKKTNLILIYTPERKTKGKEEQKTKHPFDAH